VDDAGFILGLAGIGAAVISSFFTYRAAQAQLAHQGEQLRVETIKTLRHERLSSYVRLLDLADEYGRQKVAPTSDWFPAWRANFGHELNLVRIIAPAVEPYGEALHTAYEDLQVKVVELQQAGEPIPPDLPEELEWIHALDQLRSAMRDELAEDLAPLPKVQRQRWRLFDRGRR
jgi:hypothetical protein